MREITFENVDEKVYKETLPNGLEVILIPKREMNNTFATFVTDFGAADLFFVPLGGKEPIESPMGVAHFLEHKLFDKGEDRDIVAEFSRLGAQSNAYTNATETAYYFAATDHAYENVRLLIDFVQDSFFVEETVESEKGIIVQESQMYADDPGQRLYFLMLKSLFSKHPVKNEVLGTIDSINGMTKEDLDTAFNTFYHPSNMKLCVTGNFDLEKMMDMIKEDQEKKEYPAPTEIVRIHTEEPAAVASKETTIHMPIGSPKCSIGIKEYETAIDPEQLAKRTRLTEITLDHFFGLSGEFYKELYDEGLIDGTYNYSHTLDKDFGFTMLTSNSDNPDAFADKLKSQLLSLKDYKVDAELFERLKKRTIGRTLRKMNSIEANAEEYVWHAIRGIEYFDTIPTIQSLTVEDWQSFLKVWISEERLAVCTIMPEN
ncbi:insulinase family protein [Sporosarcina sp. Sa2YVA2]|uniref:Insulinase family protein n=1 Tax=Sporosarcina quadrami TaxID=2762234 RepID=A0ABR8UAF2_9BACL|nr:pitrilysin family protein [Sporosarcina quadrami]MBD7985007.1 insulinase family protein [Sporosarcina quadrami]